MDPLMEYISGLRQESVSVYRQREKLVSMMGEMRTRRSPEGRIAEPRHHMSVATIAGSLRGRDAGVREKVGIRNLKGGSAK
jgi:hypothetical protein